MMPRCQECGHERFFWHCQPGWGSATCLRCKVLNYFKPEGEPATQGIAMPRNLREFIFFVEGSWPPLRVEPPARFVECPWPGLAWEIMTACEQLVALRLLGSKAEKDKVASFLQARPECVTWRDLIKAVFVGNTSNAPMEILGNKNRWNDK